jgi:hypothetical protein
MLSLVNVGRDRPASSQHALAPQQPLLSSGSFTKPFMGSSTAALEMQRLQLAASQQHAQMQTLQIDAAIRLLQMQYNSLLSQVMNQSNVYPEQTSCRVPPVYHPATSKAEPSEAESGVSRKRGRSETESDSMKVSATSGNGNGSVVLNSEVNCFDLDITFSCNMANLTTLQTACEIYNLRPKVWDRRGGKSDSQSSQIAAHYGVTAKTVRDIW